MMNFTTIADAKRQTKLSYLGSINSSAKLIKNKKVSDNYTYIIYLAPATTSSYNTCKYSTPECRLGCLSNSGRVKVEDYSGKSVIRNARVKKTKLFFEEQEFFMHWMVAEMKSYQKKAKKDNYFFSARLNGTSDIDWTEIRLNGKTIFEIFPDVQFYDYTKNPNMYMKQLPENYHLTFSYSGRNESLSLKLLAKGYNVAVVFDTAELPETWNGYKVINGDLTDYRPLDGNGVVVGLKYKEMADKAINEQIKNSCFVVKTVHLPERIKELINQKDNVGIAV